MDSALTDAIIDAFDADSTMSKQELGRRTRKALLNQ